MRPPFALAVELKNGFTLFTGEGESWGNGYVAIPPSHPIYGIDYNAIEQKYGINVHGGLTYSEYGKYFAKRFFIEGMYKDYWIIGFDTKHFGDSGKNRPDRDSVLAEANRLLEQVNKIV